MSRIWKQPIVIPTDVTIKYDNKHLVVSWPKWTLEYTLLPDVDLEIADSLITVTCSNESDTKFWWLTRTLISNMVVWVSQWFEKKLHVLWVWYNVKLQGRDLILNLWFSHPINYKTPEHISFSLEKDQKGNDIITVSGMSKELVGQVAASLRMFRKPEPYKGKWVRYFGEKVRQKAGKTATK